MNWQLGVGAVLVVVGTWIDPGDDTMPLWRWPPILICVGVGLLIVGIAHAL